MLSLFRGRELLRIGKRLDRAARERADAAALPTSEERASAVEAESRRLRRLLRGSAGRAADPTDE